MLEEMHAIIRGNVQGVGFRHTCRTFAARLGLTGTVCNMPDGSVELYAQGPKKDLESLLAFLRKEFGSNIEGISFEFYSPKETYGPFTIRME